MKEKKGYVYSSTELSRYYGISVKGMEFYEQKNLVHPERIGPGKTRRYNLLDCYQLSAARMLRNCGFKIEDTSALLENNRPEFLCEELGERAEQIEESIRLQEGVLRGIERIREGIRKVEEEDFTPCLTGHGGFYRLFIRQFTGMHTSTRRESDQLSLWNSLMPVTEASLRFSKEELQGQGERLNTEVGMILSEADFETFGLQETERVTHIAPGRAVYGIVAGPETELDRKRWLQGLLDFIADRGLTIAGDGFSRLIFVMQDGQGARRRYDEVWIPVE